MMGVLDAIISDFPAQAQFAKAPAVQPALIVALIIVLVLALLLVLALYV